jgi:hypothetical protein
MMFNNLSLMNGATSGEVYLVFSSITVARNWWYGKILWS